MERFMKLVEARPQSDGRSEGIFDIKTYQQTFDKLTSSASIEHILNNKHRRISFSETSNKHPRSNYSNNSNQPGVKKEIRPHQARIVKPKITDLIKNKLDNTKIVPKEAKLSDSIFQSVMREKKSSYSAYINARKKIFEKQTTLNLNYSVGPQIQHERKDNSLQDIHVDIQSKEKQLLILDKSSPQLHAEQRQMDQAKYPYMGRNSNQICLEKIITKSRVQAIKTRREIEIITGKIDEEKIPQIKTPYFKRGFITVIKRKKAESNLMVSNSNTNKNSNSPQKAKVSSDPPAQSFDAYKKNFIGQKNLGEEEIELFPNIQFIKPHKSSEQYAYKMEDFNSKSITILHFNHGSVTHVFGHNEKQKLEIASITKVMTCYLSLIVSDKFGVDIKKERIMVSERASKMQGTSARLSYADTCTIYQMLHALMLPSGNDAAIALGQWGGKTIRRYSALLRRLNIEQSNNQSNKSSSFLASLAIKKKSNLRLFVHHMNKLAKFLKLGQTFFVNTHGLMNEKAHSSSHDVSLLTYYAMKNHIFRQIVGKQTFKCKLFNRTFSHLKDISWDNTNKLLSLEGFLGVKTGITPAAGPCLTSFYQISSEEYFIIAILKTKSCQMRFKETINLLKATLLNFMNFSSSSKIYRKALVNLERYDKIDLKEDEQEFMNDCRESTTSHSDRQGEDDDDLDAKYRNSGLPFYSN